MFEQMPDFYRRWLLSTPNSKKLRTKFFPQFPAPITAIDGFIIFVILSSHKKILVKICTAFHYPEYPSTWQIKVIESCSVKRKKKASIVTGETAFPAKTREIILTA